MPPKKAAGAAKSDNPAPAADADGNSKFSWTVENERRLLLLCLGRPSVSGNDWREFLKGMPAGASFQGIRQRYGKLNREARALCEEHGISAPFSDGAASASKGKKRPASTLDNDGDEDAATETNDNSNDDAAPAVLSTKTDEAKSKPGRKKKDAAPVAKKPRGAGASKKVKKEDEGGEQKQVHVLPTRFTSVNAGVKAEGEDYEEEIA